MTRAISFAARGGALAALLALAACTSPDRFSEDGRFGGPGAGYPGAGGIATGPLDPASPQYFESAVGDRVLFAVDQSTLSPQAEATLAAQAAWLNQNPEYTAIVEGHADEQGTREYNLALGNRRAVAARDYLVSRGVASGRLQVVTYGKERPIEICSTESCYAKNRRAVTVIASGLTS